MPDPDENATRTLDAARELGPKIRAAENEIEQGRRLPMHLVREMQRAGLFRMAMPRAWGGPELDFLTQVRVIEALSIADGSAGWCTMIGVDGGYMTAYIDQGVAREMYRDLDSVTAITFAPPGKAAKTKDGFIVSGRWPFGSGCQHASSQLSAKLQESEPAMDLLEGSLNFPEGPLNLPEGYVHFPEGPAYSPEGPASLTPGEAGLQNGQSDLHSITPMQLGRRTGKSNLPKGTANSPEDPKSFLERMKKLGLVKELTS